MSKRAFEKIRSGLEDANRIMRGANMSPAQLRRAGEALYGPHWVSPLAAALGVRRRTVAGWAAGMRNGRPVEIPEGIEKEISALARKRVAALKSL